MTDERRDAPRVPVYLEVFWEAAAGRYEARTSDVSLHGCFVDSVGQVVEGETIKFRLNLPEGDSIEVEGLVTYAHPTIGFGVRFTNVVPEDRAKLERILAGE